MNVKNYSQAKKGLSQLTILGFFLLILALTITPVLFAEYFVDINIERVKEEIEKSKNPEATSNLEKLTSEIRRVYSETRGGKFWINLISVFVVVGGAVGGYLIAQSQVTQAKLAFEGKKEVDKIITEIFQEFATSDTPVLRTVGAVKLGEIMENFPVEWDISDERKNQIIQLIKNILAASLSLEENETVQKVITSNLARHYRWRSNQGEHSDRQGEHSDRADLRNLDLSNAKASGAYWAKVNASNTDFYKADLTGASFREAILQNAQFRNTTLTNTVLASSDCTGATFKHVNMQGADLRKANLTRAMFFETTLDEAKVYGATIQDANFQNLQSGKVDISEKGDGSEMIEISQWVL